KPEARSLINLDDSPALLALGRLSTGKRERGLRERKPRLHVAVELARDFFLRRRRGPAVEPHPHAQDRIREAIPLHARHDQVDILEPREIVLGGSRRAAKALRDLGERQRLFFRQDLEDGLERAISARAVEPKL